MRSKIKLTLLGAFVVAPLHFAYAEALLDEIKVTEKIIANEHKPFTEAKAKSARENLFQSSESVDAVVRSMPGAFTQQDKSTGVLSLNIRGETGFWRANTMIDGVTQTFYATSPDAGRGGSSHSVLNNYAKGRTFVLSLSYKF